MDSLLPSERAGWTRTVDLNMKDISVFVGVLFLREAARQPWQSMIVDLVVKSIFIFVVGCLSRELVRQTF